jgi:hypothetical protein
MRLDLETALVLVLAGCSAASPAGTSASAVSPPPSAPDAAARDASASTTADASSAAVLDGTVPEADALDGGPGPEDSGPAAQDAALQDSGAPSLSPLCTVSTLDYAEAGYTLSAETCLGSAMCGPGCSNCYYDNATLTRACTSASCVRFPPVYDACLQFEAGLPPVVYDCIADAAPSMAGCIQTSAASAATLGQFCCPN